MRRHSIAPVTSAASFSRSSPVSSSTGNLARIVDDRLNASPDQDDDEKDAYVQRRRSPRRHPLGVSLRGWMVTDS
jgi:hypothetical protein